MLKDENGKKSFKQDINSVKTDKSNSKKKADLH